MSQLKPTRTVYSVSQFLEWQRAGILKLKPVFQRRQVWPPKLKSLLIDTVVKGLPIPIIFLRQVQSLETLTTTMEVVDGQQRLRTLLAFIDRASLSDFDPVKDEFLVKKTHNPDIADTPFARLDRLTRADILSYEISTHVFPPGTGDEAVLRIFSRLNSTGAQLNHQELRNAEYYGDFKTLSYELALQNLQRWRDWGVFSDDEIARMAEVEATSDYLLTMMDGIYGKSQARLNNAYRDLDDGLVGADVLEKRFSAVLNAISDCWGKHMVRSRLKRPALFYSLFAAICAHMFGLGGRYARHRKPLPLPRGLASDLSSLNSRIAGKELPPSIQDAMDKSTADIGRRKQRHEYFMKELGLASA